MNADKLSQVRAWAKRGPKMTATVGWTPDPYEVQPQQMASGWAREATAFHADTIEHRARIGNLESGISELVEHVGALEAANVEARMLLLKAYAPLRNAHRKARPSHRDVTEWSSSGAKPFCPTCDVLRQMQEELDRVKVDVAGIPYENLKAMHAKEIVR